MNCEISEKNSRSGERTLYFNLRIFSPCCLSGTKPGGFQNAPDYLRVLDTFARIVFILCGLVQRKTVQTEIQNNKLNLGFKQNLFLVNK